MKIKFTKMQAFGNDYVYIDAIGQKIEAPGTLARRISDRHFGAGSDGMVMLCPSKDYDFRMRIFNPDGSEAEMCGNALRSAAKLFYCSGFSKKETLTVETLGGIQIVDLILEQGEVVNIHARIGKPEFRPQQIPVAVEGENFLDQELQAVDRVFRASTISFGNPHTVLLMDSGENMEKFDIETYGPAAERHEYFPRRTNVTFAQILDESHIRIREWERNCGETLGCGTGCCAAVVVGASLGLCGRHVWVEQPGGVLEVEWDQEGFVHMTGSSHIVYRGEYEYEVK